MINQETINEMTRRLVKAYNPVAIYLFGSYAWGTPTEDSDVDLMVLVNTYTTSSIEMIIQGQEALASIRQPKDILVNTIDVFEDRAKHNTTLQKLIKDKGVLVYEQQH